ncbi:unnamed protein product [Arctogadus glacialis]
MVVQLSPNVHRGTEDSSESECVVVGWLDGLVRGSALQPESDHIPICDCVAWRWPDTGLAASTLGAGLQKVPCSTLTFPRYWGSCTVWHDGGDGANEMRL